MSTPPAPEPPEPVGEDVTASCQAVVDAATDAIVTADVQGTITAWNAAAARIFGWGEAEAVGQPLTSIMPERYGAEHPATMERFRAGGERRVIGSVVELVGRRRDGNEFPIELSLSEWQVSGERFVTAIIRDISERHAAQQALLQSEVMRDAAEHIAHAASFNWDLTTPHPTWSAEVYALLDVARGEFDGDVMRALDARVHPDDREALQRDLDAVATRGMLAPIDFRIVRRDGTERVLHSEGNAERAADGTLKALFGYLQDVTEHQESERRYRSLFEDSPVAMWEEDHSAVKVHLRELSATGVEDVAGYLYAHPEEYRHCLDLASTLDTNRAAVTLFEAESREQLLERQAEVCAPGVTGGLPAFWAALLAGQRTASYEEVDRTLGGRELHVLETASVVPGHEKDWSRVYLADVDVSERRRAKELLSRYGLLFAEARDIMLFVRAADGHIVEANAAAEAAYGYARDELLKLDVQDLRAADGRGLTARQMAAAGADGILFETEHRRKDGSIFPVEVSSRGVTTPDGQTLLFSVVRDVSVRRAAEAALHESETMRDVAERVSRIGSFRRDLDPTSPRATWSRGMYAVLDMDAADFDGDPLPVLEARVHPDDRARVRQAGEDVAAGGAPAPVEFRIVHHDGSEHILYSESALECDEAGTPVAIAGYYRDVTEQRRAEEANARLAAIVESSEDAVFSKTIEGTILTWNAGAERMYGYAADEIIGESVALLIPPGSEGELIELLDHIRSGTPIERHEAVRLRKDGSELDVSLSMSPIRDAAGRVVGASAIAHDVTERRRAEQKILRLDRLYVTLAAVNRVIVRAQTRGSLFEDICRVAVEEGGFRMAWIGLIDEADQQVRPATSAGHEDGYLTDFEIAYLDEELGRGPTGTAIREGRCVICQDIAGDPRMAPWRASALDHGYRSSASVPIRQGGAVIGALTVYSDESAAFGVDDEGLLDGAGRDISYALDSLQALEAVRQSEAMRDSAEHAARTGSFRWCLGSPGSAWSPEVRELFDVAPGEFDEDIVRAIGARVHPDDLEALGRRVADVAANGALATVEFRVRRRDGSERVIMAGGTGERDAESTVVALVGYVQDVTEQRRVEMELRESEAMRDLAESVAHVGSLRWDLASQRVALTPEGCRLFGVSPEDFDGDIATILGGSVHPDDLGIAERALVASAETGISDPVEFRLLLPDDTVRFVHGEGKAERDASGAPIAIVGYFQDVTEQRLAKQELELAYDRLDIAQQAAGAGTFEFHAETRGFSFSPQLYGLFGLDPESDPGSFDTLRRVVHPDDIEATWETYASALRDRTQLQAEYRIIRASDGEVRWVDSLGHGVYDDAGRPLSLIGLCVDVTERKRGEQALRENAERHSAIRHTAMDGYVLVDTGGHLLEVNEAYCQMSGYSAEELQHMHLSDLESAEAPDETQAHIEKILASGADRFETRHRRKDGSVYDVETSVQYRSSEHGQFVAFLRDVTERKRSERLLGVPSEILSIMSTAMAAPETAARIVRTLKEATGFDAVGIRLRDGDDYPFVAAMGYPDDFLKAENSLTTNQPGVGLCRTADGAVALDCTCGLVISGATDPSNPLFTPGGSAWTSDASRAPEGPAVEDQRLRPRDRCVHVGFRSIALVPLRAGDQILGLMHLADNGPGHFTPEAIGFFEGLGASIGVALLRERAEEELTRSAHELREQLFDTVKAMGAIVGVRDPYTAAHELRVTGLALAVAEEMGLDEERREGLALAGEVHDIGKVAVPAEILSKPAALNEIEFTLVRQHSETGREILSAINFRQPVAAIVAQHHERLDGSGYPDGLKGDEIMLESRILAVADVVEAMSSHRPYRPGLGLEAALAEARSGAGTRYDGDVVAACERVFAQGFVFPEA